MLSLAATDKLVQKICKVTGVELYLDDAEVVKDNGWADIANNEIHLGSKYSSPSIKLVIFFHELAHIQIARSKAAHNEDVCTFMEEFAAWHHGMDEYFKWCHKTINKTQGNFILKCLKTYSKTHYSFKNKDKELSKDADLQKKKKRSKASR